MGEDRGRGVMGRLGDDSAGHPSRRKPSIPIPLSFSKTVLQIRPASLGTWKPAEAMHFYTVGFPRPFVTSEDARHSEITLGARTVSGFKDEGSIRFRVSSSAQ